jgi:hypothetical protein
MARTLVMERDLEIAATATPLLILATPGCLAEPEAFVLLGIRWGSLRAKIIAWTFVPAALILAAVAWVAYVSYQRVTEDLVIERNQQLVRIRRGLGQPAAQRVRLRGRFDRAA